MNDQQSVAQTAASAAGVQLRVKGADGKIVVARFADMSEAQAIRAAAARGQQVMGVVTAAAQPVSRAAAGRFNLMLFSQELLALLDAGLNLTEALQTLFTKERQAIARQVLQFTLASLREGRNFSDVLSAQPAAFPEVYVATMRAAERTGDLPQALARYIAYGVQFDSIRKKAIAACIYPVMLLLVGGSVTLFLLGYIVPRFSAVYASSGQRLPFLSAMMLELGRNIHSHGMAYGAGLIAVIALAVYTLAQPARRAAFLEVLLNLPLLSAKVNEFRLSRFYRALGLLLASGIALPRALGMVHGMLSQKQQPQLVAVRLAIDQGQPLSNALLASGLATPVAESLLRVGERSGQMADMLERTARFHDDDFARWVDWASRLLEPLLMLFIGLVIGSVVVLMYMPIFDLTETLQ